MILYDFYIALYDFLFNKIYIVKSAISNATLNFIKIT